MKAAPWTEAHRREAAACLCRIGENAALRGDIGTLRKAMTWVILGDPDERGLRVSLADLLDAKVINREVRRVRALAEGRLVRETEWHVGAAMFTSEADAAAYKSDCRKRYPRLRPLARRVTRVWRSP